METSGSKSPRALANPVFIVRLLAAVLLIGLIAWQAMCSPAGWAAPPGQQDSGIGLVNADQEFIDRRGDGGFVARPVFNPQPDFLGYGVKDPVNGSWLTAVYLMQGGPRRVSDGWEYAIEYPTLDSQPRLDSERAYTLVLLASRQGQLRTFEQMMPVYQSSSLWDRVLNAFNPATWAKAFAGWVIEGVHGVICSVVQRVSSGSVENCQS